MIRMMRIYNMRASFSHYSNNTDGRSLWARRAVARVGPRRLTLSRLLPGHLINGAPRDHDRPRLALGGLDQDAELVELAHHHGQLLAIDKANRNGSIGGQLHEKVP